MTPWRPLPIALTALLGVAASIGVFVWSASTTRQIAMLNFEHIARDQVSLINSDLEDAASVLETLRTYFEANKTRPDREEFGRFADLLRSRSVGLRDVAWAPRVPASERARYEQEGRKRNGPGFQVTELTQQKQFIRAGNRPEYFPIEYAAFGIKNSSAVLGIDLSFEPQRRNVIDKAIETGKAATTPPVTTFPSRRPRDTILGYAIVFPQKNGERDISAPPTGLVMVAFDIDAMVKNIIGAKHRLSGADLYFFLPGEPIGKRLIYWHSESNASGPAPDESALRALPHWEGTIAMIDQTWGVIALLSGGTPSGYLTMTALTPLSIGLLLTAMIVVYLFVSLHRTRQLEAMTVNLRETTRGLREQADQIVEMARSDSLTGLANRSSMLDALGRAVARAARGETFALLCLDLDRFKHVNDTLGHPIGDALLRAVAERLRATAREVDTVARLGGDEFTVIQAAVVSPELAALLAQRIIDAISAPYDISHHRVVIGVTIGIAIGDGEQHDPTALMRNADLALYRAKQEGRGTFRFFEPEMDARAQQRRQMELDLRAGIDREEFAVQYQPMVSILDRRVVAFEALVRWHHPTKGLISPNDFIPLAEEIGLVVPIGAWVLRTACRDAASWPDCVRVAVNVSAVQFARADVVRQVSDALRESGLAPERLEIEVTEVALRNHNDVTLRTLHDLRALGVKIAMDDFGSGYSSLNYLRSFMFNKLKVDASFIATLAEAGDSAAIVRAIAGIGTSLGITTTAEGVETQEQMEQLVRDGFTELQGYLFAKPCLAGEVPALLVQIAKDAAA
jgi:diguanylate cyclase (GGDEF)-like protein